MNEPDITRAALRAVEIYEARHPRPTHVNITQVAQMLGLSKPTAKKILVSEGIRTNAAGRYPIELIDRLREARSP